MSPLTSDADFIDEKNQETNQPIYLYRVEIDDTPANDLFRTSDKDDVDYYKDASTPQTYAATSVRHADIVENESGKIDSLSITFGNVSQEMIAYALLYDSLRNRHITIRQTFRKFLAGEPGASASAHVEYFYVIDHAVAEGRTVKFFCVSPMDVLNVSVPTRMYRRNHCGWRYKTYGCWTLNGGTVYLEPTGWRSTGMQLFTGERIGRMTIPLYEGVVTDRDDDDAEAEVLFAPISIPQLTKGNGTLQIDLRTDRPGALGANQQIEICSGGDHDLEEWFFPYSVLSALSPAVSTSWETYNIPMSTMLDTGGGLNVTGINYLRWYNLPTDGRDQILQWRNASILVAGGLSENSFYLQRPINMHGLTKANGTLHVDLKCDYPAKISGNSQIELSSSGALDTDEWFYPNLSGLGITTGYTEKQLALSGFQTAGGELDVSAFRFMRVYAWSTDSSPIVLSFQNPHIEYPGALDVCNRTRQACRRHNNIERFGGFPSIAGRTLTRGG